MKKIYRLYMEDKITSDGFGNSYKPLEARLKEISDQIPELQGEIDFLKIQYISRDETLSEFQSLYERWKTLTEEEKRLLVEHSVDRISVGTDEISIELGYMPSSSELMASKQRRNADSWASQRAGNIDSAFSCQFDRMVENAWRRFLKETSGIIIGS